MPKCGRVVMFPTAFTYQPPTPPPTQMYAHMPKTLMMCSKITKAKSKLTVCGSNVLLREFFSVMHTDCYSLTRILHVMTPLLFDLRGVCGCLPPARACVLSLSLCAGTCTQGYHHERALNTMRSISWRFNDTTSCGWYSPRYPPEVLPSWPGLFNLVNTLV